MLRFNTSIHCFEICIFVKNIHFNAHPVFFILFVAIHQLELDEWRQQDANFVEIEAVKYIDTNIQKYHTMTVTGKPGMGKSATVHHVALLLNKIILYIFRL